VVRLSENTPGGERLHAILAQLRPHCSRQGRTHSKWTLLQGRRTRPLAHEPPEGKVPLGRRAPALHPVARHLRLHEKHRHATSNTTARDLQGQRAHLTRASRRLRSDVAHSKCSRHVPLPHSRLRSSRGPTLPRTHAARTYTYRARRPGRAVREISAHGALAL
jgi:hypothetical protein